MGANQWMEGEYIPWKTHWVWPVLYRTLVHLVRHKNFVSDFLQGFFWNKCVLVIIMVDSLCMTLWSALLLWESYRVYSQFPCFHCLIDQNLLILQINSKTLSDSQSCWCLQNTSPSELIVIQDFWCFRKIVPVAIKQFHRKKYRKKSQSVQTAGLHSVHSGSHPEAL